MDDNNGYTDFCLLNTCGPVNNIGAYSGHGWLQITAPVNPAINGRGAIYTHTVIPQGAVATISMYVYVPVHNSAALSAFWVLLDFYTQIEIYLDNSNYWDGYTYVTATFPPEFSDGYNHEIDLVAIMRSGAGQSVVRIDDLCLTFECPGEGECPSEGEGENEDILEGEEIQCNGESLFSQLPCLINNGCYGMPSLSTENYPYFENFSAISAPIDSITWWFDAVRNQTKLWVSCDVGFLPTVMLRVYDNAPEPPFPLIREEVLTPTIEYIGLDSEYYPIYKCTAQLSTPLEVQSGWISLTVPDGYDCMFHWASAANGDSYSWNFDPWTEQYTSHNWDLSLCLNPVLQEGEGTEDEGEGIVEGEGTIEGITSEGSTEEGEAAEEGEGQTEGFIDGEVEGQTEGEGQVEGVNEGEGEGAPIEGEGSIEGEGITTEGLGEGLGEGEGITEGEGQTEHHTADQNNDHQINLSELLRVIQFFNSGGLHCDSSSEDGYAPGPAPDKGLPPLVPEVDMAPDKGWLPLVSKADLSRRSETKTDCAPHASDYNTHDWIINLSELLRLIQFFNTGAYHPCPGSEDNFCPGPA